MNSFKQFSTLLSRKPTPPPDKENNNGNNNNNNNNSPQREKDEKLQYDHLVFLVHGIGEHEEKWKTIVPKLLKCHKRVTNYMALNARVKWIPIEWHSVLHTQTDEHVVKVTPKGMTGPRNFINTTLIDVLFWASPYGQTIITEVGQQLNQMYSQFKKDHPDFSGSVSIYAHSLGSIICFDLLSNQPNAVPTPSDDTNDTNKTPVTSPRPARKENGNISTWQRLSAKEAPAESPLPGEPQLKYPQIEFEVENLFMLGSPTGIFLTARGADYPIRLPKCNNLYNIYNPNDPVAYLIEPLVDAGFMNLAPALVPHIPDTTEQFKGAVARGSKSLFSYYKNTTTTTTTTATSPSTSTTTTTTTSITKEVLPSSPPPSSAATSPSILAGEVVGDLLAIDDLTITESTVVETLGMETTGEPSLSPRPTRRDAEKDEDINNNHPLSPSWEVVVEKVEKSSISTTTNTTTNNGNLNRSAPTSPTPAPPPAAGNGNGANNTEKSNVFFEGVRYDYKLQPSGIVENLSEYAALINAHRGYWDSRDVMLFVLQKLYSV